MTTKHRLLAGGTAIVAGLWFLTGAGAAPDLPADSYKRAITADIAQLQKHLNHIVTNLEKSPREANRYGPTTRGLAMALALSAEATGDEGLQGTALKLADMLGKKNWKGAEALAKTLASKPGAAPLKPGNLHSKSNFALDEVMSPFRGSTVGGVNIEKDIRGIRDGKIAPDPVAIEIIAVRSGLLSDFAMHMPNDKATVNKAKTDEWVKLCKDSIEISNKLAKEAAKGRGANAKEMVGMVKALDAKCVSCHKDFRDD